MKVFMRYDEHEDKSLHKTLKITLPKSWQTGPTSKLMDFFCESYNGDPVLGAANPLDPSLLRLLLLDTSSLLPAPLLPDDPRILPSDAPVSPHVPDRASLSVASGGPPPTLAAREAALADRARLAQIAAEEAARDSATCVRLGCGRKYSRSGPAPACSHHVGPPVFHETAKFWSCCPKKKAYDWDDFRAIPGCRTGFCTEEKEEGGGKAFLGGCDLREKQAGPKLQSIEDFNRGGEGKKEKLREALEEAGVEGELFDQVAKGIQEGKGMGKDLPREEGGEVADDEVVRAIGSELKRAFKNMAVQQQRIS